MSGPKRVLLVDDDKTLQGLLAEQLETTREFSTLCVNDAAAALQAAPGEQIAQPVPRPHRRPGFQELAELGKALLARKPEGQA